MTVRISVSTLVGIIFVVSPCFSTFPNHPNASGEILLRIRCPKDLTDCHFTSDNCYSLFNICVEFEHGESCSFVPTLEKKKPACTEDEMQKVLDILTFPIKDVNKRLHMRVETKNVFGIQEPPLVTKRHILLPGLKILSNATKPSESNWTQLTTPGDGQLRFEISAVVQCRLNHFSPSCHPLPRTPATQSTRNTTLTLPLNHTLMVTTPVDPCSTFSCQNEGICRIDNTSMPKCICSAGWKGTYCEEKDLCIGFSCNNGGKCRMKDNRRLCDCQAGWLGLHCDERDRCVPQPCRNGGNCSNDGNGYTCRCPLFHFGSNCEIHLLPSSMNTSPKLIIILVCVLITGFVVLLTFVGVYVMCRRSRTNNSREQAEPRSILDQEVYLRQRRARLSGVYEKVDGENCYTEASSDDEVVDETEFFMNAEYDTPPTLPPRNSS